LALSKGDRLQLKANGEAVNGRKIANGELVTIKEIRPDGRIALEDGRVLEKSYRQFVWGYAVTSYAAQGKAVDYVLFSDSATQAATNDQQWYVTISRGRKGVKIFTADKIQLRQNVTRAGDRPLALDIAKPKEGYARKLADAWGRSIKYVLNVQHAQRQAAQRRSERMRQGETARQSETIQESESLTVQLAQAQKKSELVRQSQTIRRTQSIVHRQQRGPRYGGGIGV
jgi:hypothetical protein